MQHQKLLENKIKEREKQSLQGTNPNLKVQPDYLRVDTADRLFDKIQAV